MLLHHDFQRRAKEHPSTIALVCSGERVTYGDLATRSRILASTLRQQGLMRGDRVALLLDNGVEFVAGVLAALEIGAVFMPINPSTKGDKLAFVLQDARASALLTQHSLAGEWESAVAVSPSVRTVVVTGGTSTTSVADVPVTPWPKDGDETLRTPDTIDQDLAAIIYTSGSTGRPKGVMLSHLNMVSAARSVGTYLDLREDDVILCALPLSFDYGLYQLFLAFRVGARVVIERNFSFPVSVVGVMEREQVTIFPGVPTMFAMLLGLQNLNRFDLGQLRMVTNTAAALPEGQIRRLRETFPGVTLFSMYGLTECKRVTYLPPDQLDVRPTSVGRGMPNQEVWLVDDEGRRLPNGSVGELVIRGSHVMRGYWERPEETSKRLKPGPVEAEKVLYSGDLFRTDEEGWLYFVGRRDDIIKSRGEKVSPREVENAIHDLEGVYEVAVVGVPDEVLGEAVKALVVRSAGATLTERDVIRHCLARLESFMAPKHVEFVNDLPKTDTGKIRKTGLS
jgi:long-chain acyl-CoA synthetase